MVREDYSSEDIGSGPLTLENELFASGKIVFNRAGSDSAVYLGWFDSNSKTNKLVSDHSESQKNFLAILIEGPSRVGHYFRAAYSVSGGRGITGESGPIIRPDRRIRRWSIHYSPESNQGRRQIIVQLDDEKHTLQLGSDHRKQGASFDRFGVFNLQAGGHFVDITLDDLTYSASSSHHGGRLEK